MLESGQISMLVLRMSFVMQKSIFSFLFTLLQAKSVQAQWWNLDFLLTSSSQT